MNLVVGAGADGFAQVRPDWDALQGRSSYFFQTTAWVDLLSQRLDGDVVWIAARDDERPAAALALLRVTRSAGGFKLRMLQRVRLGEADMLYEDGLLDPDAFGAHSRRELLNATGPWQVMRLIGLRARSPWLELADGGLLRPEAEGGSGIFDTSMAFEDCWRAVPKNMRNSIRKARRKIDERGGAEIVVETGGPAIEAAYNRFLVLEASGWKADEGGGLTNMPVEGGLWGEYLRTAANAQVRSLFVDGRFAAGQIAIRSARTLFLARIAYDEELSELSPSNVLMADLIEDCCNDPEIDRIDCMMWQAWHQRWGMEREPTYSLTVFNDRSVRGLLTRAAWRGRERLRG